jgi:hypothetical protein
MLAKAVLRKVVHRKPVPYMPHAHVPKYLLVYIIESLECGHRVVIYPDPDPLVAKFRRCGECDQRKVIAIDTLRNQLVLAFPEPTRKRA